MKNNMRIALIALALYLSYLTPSFALETERYTSVNIIPERTHNIKPGDTITIATEVILAPEWHVYWRNPGDSGLPVIIKWNAPEGFKFSEIEWPTPDKISYDILANYGYYTKVTLLQKLYIPDSYNKEELTLDASIDMLVCKEICIPESSNTNLTLNNPNAPRQNHSALIQTSQEKLPKPINGSFTYAEDQDNLILTVQTDDINININNLEFFPYEWGVLQYTANAKNVKKGKNVQLIYPRSDRDLSELKTLEGLLVITGDKNNNIGYKISASPETTANTQQQSAEQQQTFKSTKANSSLTWISAIGLALIGGLILNLMPCVFPVLSMKAISFVKMGEKENKQARTHGTAYTAGVIISFIIIGLLLITLQQTGSAIGWGFQLQNPIIVTVISYLLFTIGLNLMGFFEFGNSLGNVGSKMTQGSSISSSFFTGTLVTFVAAPCIGPFLGASMGYALTQPPLFSIIFFSALGFGLASPYLILSYIPATRTLLPKPGAWMNTFKQLLAFPMFASAIIFIWVLSQQAGSDAALLALIGLLMISFLVWLSRYNLKHTLIAIIFAASLVTLIGTLFSIQNVSLIQTHEIKAETFGKNFSNNNLKKALEGNRPVFVEMTAAWCFTCKINHAIAINVNSTKALFKKKDVHYLIGDWTNYNREITDYLAQYGRNGVPLYVYYAPRKAGEINRPKPIILPQVLTPGIVQETIGQ